MGYEKSIEAMKIAENLMPGGVNSPVRAFKSVDTPAIFMDHAKGSRIYDIDGNEYIDYVLSWGPLILGHKNEQVIKNYMRLLIEEQASSIYLRRKQTCRISNRTRTIN